MAIAKKVMLLGDTGVGKTSLARRLVFDKFDADYKATLGVDIYRHFFRVGADDVELVIWDIDGDLAESIFNHIYSRGAAGALILCDVARPESETSAFGLMDSFTRNLPGRPLGLVRNKVDLLTGTESAFDIPQRHEGIPAFETSAKSGIQVEEAFLRLTSDIARVGL